jgi:hypothetical protein
VATGKLEGHSVGFVIVYSEKGNQVAAVSYLSSGAPTVTTVRPYVVKAVTKI